jgi:hypothetical protein
MRRRWIKRFRTVDIKIRSGRCAIDPVYKYVKPADLCIWYVTTPISNYAKFSEDLKLFRNFAQSMPPDTMSRKSPATPTRLHWLLYKLFSPNTVAIERFFFQIGAIRYRNTFCTKRSTSENWSRRVLMWFLTAQSCESFLREWARSLGCTPDCLVLKSVLLLRLSALKFCDKMSYIDPR